MFGFILFCHIWAVCFGSQTFGSNFMHGNKPILRMGPEENQEPGSESLTEPDWVTSLRSDIKSVISRKGYVEGQDEVKNLIADANKNINHSAKKVTSLKDLPGGPDILRTFGIEAETEAPPDRYEPAWEKGLKAFVKRLIKSKKNNNMPLDKYVMPTVHAIENNANVKITDIKVNSYGDVTVKWENANNPDADLLNEMPRPGPSLTHALRFAKPTTKPKRDEDDRTNDYY